MNAEQLIAQLTELRNTYGNLPVRLLAYGSEGEFMQPPCEKVSYGFFAGDRAFIIEGTEE